MSARKPQAAHKPAAGPPAPQSFDITIVGGGMVGASLAAAVAPLGLSVALIEAVPHDAAAQPSFDERTTALSNGSRRILETLGLWSGLAADATPIRKIHVSDRGRFGFARIDAAAQGLPALGYVVPNRSLGRCLWSALARYENVRLFCPAEVSDIVAGGASVALSVMASQRGGSTAGPMALETRLIVAADGAHSAVRAAFGVTAAVKDYAQTAIITTVMPQRFHDHVAYERFTDTGPLALLPLADGRCTLVFTVDSAMSETALGWSDAQFLDEVQRRFGFRLGRLLKVGRRVPYPLSLSVSERTSAGRCVIIGNAAQGLHPVAGMGFNLGLRDVASLAELIAERRSMPGEERVGHGVAADASGAAGMDAGDPAMLAQYDAWRADDRRGIIGFTDGLVRVFSNPWGPIRQARNLALLAFDLLPPAKAALSALSMGAARRSPKLARGVALSGVPRHAQEPGV